jgi:hypothetical protein
MRIQAAALRVLQQASGRSARAVQVNLTLPAPTAYNDGCPTSSTQQIKLEGRQGFKNNFSWHYRGWHF